MVRSLNFLFLLVFLIALPVQRAKGQEATQTPTSAPIVIRTPLPGQALQGLVTILGDLDVTGFISAELSFTYRYDPFTPR